MNAMKYIESRAKTVVASVEGMDGDLNFFGFLHNISNIITHEHALILTNESAAMWSMITRQLINLDRKPIMGKKTYIFGGKGNDVYGTKAVTDCINLALLSDSVEPRIKTVYNGYSIYVLTVETMRKGDGTLWHKCELCKAEKA